MKHRIDKLFIYAQSLLKICVGEDKNFYNFYQAKGFLEAQGWIVQVTADFYRGGTINFNWQVLVVDKTGTSPDNINGDYSTGIYGDCGEYKSSFSALIYGTLRGLELYCLSQIVDIGFNKEIGESDEKNLLDIYCEYNKGPEFLTIDQEWWKYERINASEYIEYIKKRIKEIWKWKISDVDVSGQ